MNLEEGIVELTEKDIKRMEMVAKDACNTIGRCDSCPLGNLHRICKLGSCGTLCELATIETGIKFPASETGVKKLAGYVIEMYSELSCFIKI